MLKYTLMLLGSRLVTLLPLWFSYRLSSVLAYVAYLAIPSRRRLLRENLRLVTGRDDRKYLAGAVKSAYRHIAMNTVDFLLFPSLSRERAQEMAGCEGLHHLDRFLDEGRGVIFVTGHQGHYEFGGALLASLGYPTVVIAESIAPKRKILKEEKIARLFRDFREKMGVVVIPMERVMMPAVRALKRGDILVFLADRDITGHGVEVEFFGRRCKLPKGPAFFSLKLGLPIVPGRITRDRSGKHTGIIYEPVDSTGLICDDEGIRKLTQSLATRLEEMISGCPEQWFVFEPVGEEEDQENPDTSIPQDRD